MSFSPAFLVGAVCVEIRTSWRAVDPKTVATDPGDFGSVAMWRCSGLYLGRAPIHGCVGRGGGAALVRRRQGGMAGPSVADRAYTERVHVNHQGSLLSRSSCR